MENAKAQDPPLRGHFPLVLSFPLYPPPPRSPPGQRWKYLAARTMTGAMLALPDAGFAPTMPFTEIPRTQRDGDKFSQRQVRWALVSERRVSWKIRVESS